MTIQSAVFLVVLGVVIGGGAIGIATPILRRDRKATGLIKIQGHSKIYENLVPIAIVGGTTAMSAIASYVFAETQILAILAGRASLADTVVFGLVAVTGLIIDTCMIISASRFLMHMLRGDKALMRLTGGMFFFCLLVESGTLAYFFFLADPGPLADLSDAINNIHKGLYFVRDVLLPLSIAFFVTCVRPIVVSAKDRMAATYARSSQDLAALEQTITSTDEKITLAQKHVAMTAYISQHRINLYAHPGTDEEVKKEKEKAEELIGYLKEELGYVSDVDPLQIVRVDALEALEARIRSEVMEDARALIAGLQGRLDAALATLASVSHGSNGNGNGHAVPAGELVTIAAGNNGQQEVTPDEDTPDPSKIVKPPTLEPFGDFKPSTGNGRTRNAPKASGQRSPRRNRATDTTQEAPE